MLAVVDELLTSHRRARHCKAMSKRMREELVSVPAIKRLKGDVLTKRVDSLTSEFAHIKCLWQPPKDSLGR